MPLHELAIYASAYPVTAGATLRMRTREGLELPPRQLSLANGSGGEALAP